MICAVCNKPIAGSSYTVATDDGFYSESVCGECAFAAAENYADVEENQQPGAGGNKE